MLVNGKLGRFVESCKTLLLLAQAVMGPIRSGNSASQKPGVISHPALADTRGGPLSLDTNTTKLTEAC